MKILLYGINFAPEPVGVGRFTGQMAERLQAAGHEVRVVTALPYYPDWKVSPGYSPRRYVTEDWNGIRVMRAPLWVPHRPGGRKRVLHLLSFAVTSLPLLVRAWFWRPDVVWMAAPAFVCSPAALVTAKVCRAKSWIHVQDFEIDIAFGMGMISGQGWKRFIYACERWLLRRFDQVSTISKAMVARAASKGVPEPEIALIPNWADVETILPLAGPSAYRAELGIPPDAVVALYSGSMGQKQGVDWVAEVAVALQAEPNLYVVLCGDGALREAALARCGALPQVRFLPFQPAERLGELLGMADIHLLPQRPDAAEMVMPSKLTGMLASGRPVVGMGVKGSELADIVQTCGRVVDHGDVPAFAEAIRDLAGLPKLRAELGSIGRCYAMQHLSVAAVLGKLEATLEALAGEGRAVSVSAE